MAPSKAAQEKAQKRLKLHQEQTITMTLKASEHNIQRITALMLFAEVPVVFEEEPMGPLPWEDPEDPRFGKIPEVEIDYDVVSRSIAKHLMEVNEKFGTERVRAVLNSFGASRLSSVPKHQLLALEASLRQDLGPGV